MSESWPWATQFAAQATYLNTASMGLPPAATVTALQRALTQWQAGLTQPAEFDTVVEEARSLFGALVHTAPESVAVGHQVSPLVGLVAATLPRDAHVLAPGG